MAAGYLINRPLLFFSGRGIENGDYACYATSLEYLFDSHVVFLRTDEWQNLSIFLHILVFFKYILCPLSQRNAYNVGAISLGFACDILHIAIDDIGGVTATCIRQYFDNPKNRTVIDELESVGVTMKMPKGSTSSEKLAGLTIVVTGTLPTLGRKEASDLIENNGGKCTGSVSKKTDYLVAGEKAGSKLTKAQALEIPIITEEELLNMIS